MSSCCSLRSAGSVLKLEVVAGPSRGLQYSVQSSNTSKLPVTIGRVSPGDVILRDSEVSGKHAMINWNDNVSFSTLIHNLLNIMYMLCAILTSSCCRH